MSFDYDVAVVGGGPVGSTIARDLSAMGLSVCIVEKKKRVGFPLQCAGIISSHIFDLNDLPSHLILNSVRGAFLHSQNHILRVEKPDDVAFIIDRIGYDEFLFQSAVENGADVINQKAVDYDIERGTVFLNNSQKITSRIIIGCDGYSSGLSQNMGNTQSHFAASQMLVEISQKEIQNFRKSDADCGSFVDTYLFEEILPGFLWIIPLGDDLYRVGLFSNQTHKQQDRFLNDFLKKHFEFEIRQKYKGFIPIYNEKSTIAKSRAILIGDAASQVKPTSGGGLLMAFDACEIACRCVADALRCDDLNKLTDYQKEFDRKYQREFSYQFKVQKTLNSLSDDDLDYLFFKLRENDGEFLISEYGDMDEQSVLVKEFIKRGLIFKIIPSFLFKKVGKIFGFR